MIGADTEEAIQAYLNLLEKNVSETQITAYIYWPDKKMTARGNSG